MFIHGQSNSIGTYRVICHARTLCQYYGHGLLSCQQLWGKMPLTQVKERFYILNKNNQFLTMGEFYVSEGLTTSLRVILREQ